ncbi:hypothetical protein JCM18916_1450 [Cutibacterium acnes JCM 18916]|nr:hypothetical protein JCM18916_1450 [Cutibacterium acnes JCM 18916]
MRAAALMVTALGPPLFNNDAADRMSFFDVGDGLGLLPSFVEPILSPRYAAMRNVSSAFTIAISGSSFARFPRTGPWQHW